MRSIVLGIFLLFPVVTPAKPNIVFISVDTLRADYLGAYGHNGGASPFLDRMAKDGLLFESAITPLPVTTASHASMLTSVLPWRHGAIGNALPMNGSRETLAEALKRSGYRTGAAVGTSIVGRAYGFAKGFDTFDEPEAAVARRAASAVNADAKKRIDEHVAAGGARPLFLFVHYYDVHNPYGWWASAKEAEEAEAHQDMDVQRARYADGIRHVDGAIAELYAYLEKKGLAKDLVFCVTADHGEQLGDHGEPYHKDLYRETVRVPLILTGPGLPSGRVKTSVSTMDIGVSLLALARGRYMKPVDGIDLLPVAKRELSPLKKLLTSDAPRPLLVAGHSLYTHSLLLIDGSRWFIQNFDYLYREASVLSPAPKETHGRSWRVAPLHEVKDGAAVYRIPFTTYEPFVLMVDHVAARPECEAAINLLAMPPGATYFASPMPFRGSTRLTATSARFQALSVTVTPAGCGGTTVYSVSRYEGPIANALPTFFDVTFVGRRLSTGDELYDVDTDPSMRRNLLAGAGPAATRRKLRALFERATASQRDRHATYTHSEEEKRKLRSLGYIH